MKLEIQIQQDISGAKQGNITVKLDGSLDTATSPDLERKLTPVLAGQVREIVFDLAGLKFISSAGLRIFAMVAKRLKEHGGHSSFVNMQPQINDVFEIIKALPGISIFKNLEEFDEYLAARQQARLDNL